MAASRRIRSAWMIAGSLLAVGLLGYGTLQVVSVLAHEREHTHRVLAAAIRSVEVRSEVGSVHIRSTDDPAVTIDATISRGLSSPHHHETLQGDRLVVTASCPGVINTFCGVDYRLAVPRGGAVTVRSSGGGITVVDVDGDLDLSSSGGGITVTGGRGSQRLHSSGGTIRADGDQATNLVASSSGGGVHISFLEPPLNVAASSSGGGVTVTLPDTPDAYRVSASSSGGSTHAVVRTDPTSSRVINAHSSGGGVTVDYPKS